MPFTLSHPAAVLPLRRLGLPMTALAIGSMVPDVPLFLGWSRGYQVTHGLVGVVTVDPLLAVLVIAFWFGLVRDVLVELSPDVVRSRLAPHVRWTTRLWLLAPVAAALGALTHVVWDTFTHPGRWGADQIGWLHTEHAGLGGAKWAQYASGIVGLAIVTWSVVAHLRASVPISSPAPRSRWASLVVATIVASGAVAGLVTALAHAPGLHAMAFNAAVNGIIAVVVSTTAVCVVWRAVRPSPG
ncbi:DUF4184 family protein [Nocardioides sp. URHA0020]|uniref:DUF4184 family protein n=1 Tax=Nocardioides sp. URHA0020 TaxID=1380392 RepID=UPI00048C6979|nr:DUF4184 family protein [Nocardioides sp. URHA0020]